MTRRRSSATLTLIMVWSVLTLWGDALRAQNYPARPLRWLVSGAAGGVPDAVARIVAQGLSQGLGQPIVIENRVGAAGTIAMEAGAKALADGYTIVLGTTGTLASAAALYPNLRYDPIKSFSPVSQLVTAPYVVAVHPSIASTLKDFIDRAKAKPGQLNFGSGGNGGSPHVAGEMFKTVAGVQLAHVPYKAMTNAVTDLVAGRVQVMFNQLTIVQAHVQSEKLNVLCIAGPKRLVQLPGVPTTAELGLPGYDVSIWFGVIVSRGVPRDIITRLNTEMLKALATKEVRDGLVAQGFEPVGGTPEQFAVLIQAEQVKWQRATKESGARLD